MKVNYFQTANKLKQEGKLEEAIAYYYSALEQNPQFYWSYHNLGETFALLDRMDEAITAYNQAIEQNPNSASSHHNLGDILVKIGQLEGAILAYRRAVELNRNCAGFYSSLGKTFYELALQITPASLPLNYRLAEILPKPGQTKDYSADIYNIKDEEWVEVNDYLNDEEFLEQVYRVYLKRDCDEEGKSHFLKHLHSGMERLEFVASIRQSTEFTHHLINSIRATELYHLQDEDFIQATCQLNSEAFVEEVYGTYLKREPDEDGKNHYIQQIHNGQSREEIVAGFQQSSEFTFLLISSIVSFCLEQAITSHRRAIELNPNSRQSYLHLQAAFLLKGKILTQRGKLEEGIESYQQASAIAPNLMESFNLTEHPNLSDELLQVEPDNWKFYWHLCKRYAENSQPGPAIEAYKQVIKLNPDFLPAYQNLVELQPENSELWWKLSKVLNQHNQWEEAIVASRRAIALNPKSAHKCYQNLAEAFYNLGYSLMQQGESDKAMDSYKQAIAFQPDYADAYLGLGYLLTILDQSDKALLYWRRGLELCEDIQDALLRFLDRATFDRGKIELATKLYQIVYEIQDQRAEANSFDNSGTRFLSPHWVSRIGHIACIDYYVKMSILGWRPLQRTVVLATPDEISNSHFLNYWHSYIEVISDPSSIERLSPIARESQEYFAIWSLADGQVMEVHEARSATQKQWEAEGRSPLLTLSDSDSDRGWRALQKRGMPKDAWFVCLHVREPGYWGDYSAYFRNANIDTYSAAIQSIVDRGGWVIRMGNPTMKPLSPSMNQVIDYAHSDLRSDWMDVFLCASCRFLIGTDSGLTYVPSCFGVPLVMTNNAPMGIRMYSQQDIYIPKMYWCVKEERYLNFAQAMAPPLGLAFSNEGFVALDIKLVDNTPEEINDLVGEMLERVDATIDYGDEDERLQSRFNKLAEAFKCYGISRIGRDFLKKYAWLLPNSDEILQIEKTQARFGENQ